MAVEAERLLVRVVARGADRAERQIRGVGRGAVESARGVADLGDELGDVARSAATAVGPLQGVRSTVDSVGDQFSQTSRSANVAAGALGAFTGAAIGTTGPVGILRNRLGETEDEFDQVRNSAIGASGAMNTYTGSTLAATAASYTMHDAIIAGAIPSLVVLLSTLGPLVATVGALGAGLLGLAGGFGAVLGSGALAWFQTTEDAAGQLQAVLDELIAIGTEFGTQFIPLIDAAINAVPELAQRLVDATGDMTPFVNELLRLGSAAMDVLPRVLGWFMDIGREALPIWKDFTNWVGSETPAALEFFRSVVSGTWDSLHSLSLALLDALGTFTRFGVVATNVVAPMLESILGGFEGLLEWVMALPAPMRDLTVAAAALAPVFTIGAVAAGELMRIISSLSGTLTSSNSAIARLTPSLSTMAKGLTLVGAAAAALYRGYRTNFAGIRDETKRVVAAARNEFIPTFQLARSVIGPILSDLAGMFSMTGDQAEGAISGIVTMVADHLVAGIRAAGPIIREQLRGLDTWWAQHGETVTSTITEVVWAIQNALVGAINTAVPIVMGLASTFGNLQGKVRSAIVSIATTVNGMLLGAFQTARANSGLLETKWVTLQNKAQGLVTKIRSMADTFGTYLTPRLQSARDTAQQLIGKYLTADNVIAALSTAVSLLVTRYIALSSAAGAVLSPFSSAIGMARTLASTFGAGGVSGVLSMLSARFPTVAGHVSRFVGALSGVLRRGASVIATSNTLTSRLGLLGSKVQLVAGRFGQSGLRGALSAIVDIVSFFIPQVSTISARLSTLALRGRMVALAFGNAGLMSALSMVATMLPGFREGLVRLGNLLKGAVATSIRGVGTAAMTLGSRLINMQSPITTVRNLLSRFPGVMRTIVGSSGTLVRSIFNLQSAWAVLRTGIPTLISAIVRIGPAILGLSGPIGWAIGIAAALYGAWQVNLFGIRDITNQVFEGIKTTLSGDMSAVQSTINTATNAINNLWHNRILPLWDTTKQVFNQIRQVVSNVMTWIHRRAIQPALAGITSLYNTHGEEIAQEIGETYEAIRGYISTFIDIIEPIIGAFLVSTNSAWSKWGDEIMSVVNFAMDFIGNTVKVATDALITTFLVAMNVLQGDWGEAWGEIEGFLKRTLDEILSFASTWGGRLLSWLGGLIGDAISWFQDLYRDLVGGSIVPDMLSDILQEFRDFGSDTLSWLSGMVSDFLSSVRDWASDAVSEVGDLADDALSALTDLKSDFSSAGGDLIGEFASGIRDSASEAVNAAGDAVSDVRDHFPFSPAKTGALSDIDETGPALVHEFAGGIWGNLDELRRAASDAAAAARPEVGTIQPDILPPEALQAIFGGGGGGSGDVYIDLSIDARGADDPEAIGNEAEGGLGRALESENVSI